jgi:hypothetical protein
MSITAFGPGGSQTKPFIIFLPQANQPPTTDYATVDLRNNHPVLDFRDSTANEAAVFGGVLSPDYSNGGLTVDIYWLATTATSGNVKWDAEIERHQAETTDLDADSFATENTVTDTAVSPTGAVMVATITFTDGADMDSLTAGESFRIRITRDQADGADTMSGDAELLRCVVRET